VSSRPSACWLLLLLQVTATVPFSALTALCAALVQYGMTGMRPGAANIFGHCSIGMLTFLIAVQVRGTAGSPWSRCAWQCLLRSMSINDC
jgi:hypothetical protein